MNILFMSLSNYNSIYIHELYPDLLKQFINQGDSVYLISPIERRNNDECERVIKEDGVAIVKIKIWNMQKTNIIEKGISMLTIDGIFTNAIRKYFSDIKFDLILYPTPPITFCRTVEYVKKRDSAKTYLLLKDIFPQNAIDIGLMVKTGARGLLYRYFRKKEKKLYEISDYIGCMSQANVDYVISHNLEVNPNKIRVCPNAIDPIDMSCSEMERIRLRTKYSLPPDKIIFVYGGNLGKPQGIPFIIECLRKCQDIETVYFLIVGNGTEYKKIERFIEEEKPKNVKLMQRLLKEDYDMMIGSCDVGLIFLDHRFTIPNFPSRLLGYMGAKLPILACTDINSDIGKIIVSGGFGWWCESDDPIQFRERVSEIIANNLKPFGEASFRFLTSEYSSEKAYKAIMNQIMD